MLSRFFTIILFIAAFSTANAVEIVRYVAENATGDGLTKENPTGDLLGVLNMSKRVDRLTIYAEPGEYSIPLHMNDNNTTYRNVLIYGGGQSDLNPAEQKTVITGYLEINGGLVANIDLKGTLAVTACNVYFTNSRRLVYTVGQGNNSLYMVSTGTTEINKNYGLYQPSIINVIDCMFTNGDGVTVDNVESYFERCIFADNRQGIEVRGTQTYYFSDCKFIGNREKGAVRTDVVTDNIAAYFDRCVFASNTTKERNYSPVISGISPFALTNCFICDNGSVGFYDNNADERTGAVALNRSQSIIRNCTFFDNKDAAIFYSKTEYDHSTTPIDQILNTAFLDNRLPYVSRYGNSPKMVYCAADFGSDIPELDAEYHNIRIDGSSAKLLITGTYDIYIQENSALINAGMPVFGNDINHVSHMMLGGTDIGCAEYTGNWSKAVPEKTFKVAGMEYVKCKTTYKGTDYWAYAYKPNTEMETVYVDFSLYLGDDLAPFKQYEDNQKAVVYMNYGSQKYAMLYRFSGGEWLMDKIMEYSSTLPVAVNENGRWELKVPKQAAAGGNSSARSGTSSTPAKKKAATTPPHRKMPPHKSIPKKGTK